MSQHHQIRQTCIFHFGSPLKYAPFASKTTCLLTYVHHLKQQNKSRLFIFAMAFSAAVCTKRSPTTVPIEPPMKSNSKAQATKGNIFNVNLASPPRLQFHLFWSCASVIRAGYGFESTNFNGSLALNSDQFCLHLVKEPIQTITGFHTQMFITLRTNIALNDIVRVYKCMALRAFNRWFCKRRLERFAHQVHEYPGTPRSVHGVDGPDFPDLTS